MNRTFDNRSIISLLEKLVEHTRYLVIMTSMRELLDTNIGTELEGDILQWDATQQRWVNVPITVSIGILTDLGDVVITSPAAGQFLLYDAEGTQMWRNQTFRFVDNYIADSSLNGGLGTTVGDSITYAGDTYTFLGDRKWLNLRLPFEEISLSSVATPLNFTPDTIGVLKLFNFPSISTGFAFQMTQNGAGRITNADSFSWAVQILFVVNVTAATNNQDLRVRIYKNGVPISQEYRATTGTAGKVLSIQGFATTKLNGGAVSGTAVANQYIELYVANDSSLSTLTFSSAGFRVQAFSLLDLPSN